jgi:hypothetical protein
MCRYFDVTGIFFLHNGIWWQILQTKHAPSAFCRCCTCQGQGVCTNQASVEFSSTSIYWCMFSLFSCNAVFFFSKMLWQWPPSGWVVRTCSWACTWIGLNKQRACTSTPERFPHSWPLPLSVRSPTLPYRHAVPHPIPCSRGIHRHDPSTSLVTVMACKAPPPPPQHH